MTLEELSKLVESKKSTVIVSKGTSPLALLGVAFIVMKLMGYITWSWWWVLAPFWIPFVVALLLIACLLIFVAFSVKKLDKECKKIVKEAQEKINKETTTEVKNEVKTELKEEVKKPIKKSSKKSKKIADEKDSNGTTAKSKGKNV